MTMSTSSSLPARTEQEKVSAATVSTANSPALFHPRLNIMCRCQQDFEALRCGMHVSPSDQNLLYEEVDQKCCTTNATRVVSF